MSINEMIRNVKAAIPALDVILHMPEVTLSMSVDELNETVRNAMYERFVSTVKAYSEVCGVSFNESREFAVDFIQNNDYVKRGLTAAINLVLKGTFSNESELRGFEHNLLWEPVDKVCHEKLSTGSRSESRPGSVPGLIVIDLWSDDDDE